MGLTIHYNLKSTTTSAARAKQLVEKMRQLSLDLPFESVEDVRYIGPEICQTPLDELRSNGELFSTVLDGSTYIPVPWRRKQTASVTLQPLEIISFWTVPGPGSEWASFGLVRYPAETEVTYRPHDDDRFIRTIREGNSTRWEFNWRKWEQWRKQNGHNSWDFPDDEQFEEQRTIKTRLASGWRYSSFCKTQYASNPACGGVANFIRCHLCVVHLLDRIAELPTISAETDDEGKYGRSYYTDDWTVPEPVYSWHDGKYNVQPLAQEVGQWNEQTAAMFGAVNDIVRSRESGMEMESPITEYADFERLEFKGRDHESLRPFLQAMETLAAQQRAEHANGDAA